MTLHNFLKTLKHLSCSLLGVLLSDRSFCSVPTVARHITAIFLFLLWPLELVVIHNAPDQTGPGRTLGCLSS